MKATPKEIDAVFLDEYARFSSRGPHTAAAALHDAFLSAHSRRDYETVAHLQLRLLAERCIALESAFALLLAVTRWDSPKGILGAMLCYDLGDIPKFRDKLASSRTPLSVLRFPDHRDLVTHLPKDASGAEGYSDEHLRDAVKELCDLFSDDVRKVYAKSKHASIYMRHPDAFKQQSTRIQTGYVHIMLKWPQGHPMDIVRYPVSRRGGLRTASANMEAVEAVCRRTQIFARFIAFCCKNDLLTADS